MSSFESVTFGEKVSLGVSLVGAGYLERRCGKQVVF